MSDQRTAFNTYCHKQYVKNFPDSVRGEAANYVTPWRPGRLGFPAFDHVFVASRVCLWAPWGDMRVDGGAPVEFGIVSEPYNFAGNKAQEQVAQRYGFEFRRIRETGFHHPSATPYLWVVRELSKAGAIFQAMLGSVPVQDIYGFVPEGQTLTVASDWQLAGAADKFFSALSNAQGGRE
jgi:hypothetical protein